MLSFLKKIWKDHFALVKKTSRVHVHYFYKNPELDRDLLIQRYSNGAEEVIYESFGGVSRAAFLMGDSRLIEKSEYIKDEIGDFHRVTRKAL